MASKICVGVVAATTSLSLFGCGSSGDDTSTTTAGPTETIAELVVANDDLQVLGAALTAADLVSTFNTSDGNFTVFAPTNDAFYQLNGTVNCLLNLPTEMANLEDLLKYHVLSQKVMSSDLKSGEQAVPSLEGANLNITNEDGKVTINGNANVTDADVVASDGVVHIIDAVLVPPEFAALKTCPKESITTTAVAEPTLSTLVSALTQAGLANTFGMVDLGVVYTVFAPNDDAFAEVPKATIDCVMMDENKAKLTELLKYHVHADSYVFASQLKDGETLTTMDNAKVNVTITDGSVMINDATVALANVNTTNGIVHVIDKVLVPPGFSCGSSATVEV